MLNRRPGRIQSILGLQPGQSRARGQGELGTELLPAPKPRAEVAPCEAACPQGFPRKSPRTQQLITWGAHRLSPPRLPTRTMPVFSPSLVPASLVLLFWGKSGHRGLRGTATASRDNAKSNSTRQAGAVGVRCRLSFAWPPAWRTRGFQENTDGKRCFSGTMLPLALLITPKSFSTLCFLLQGIRSHVH